VKKTIVVENLKYRYPNTSKLALDSISFSVDEGQFVGIVGKNLASKYTICEALVGLVPHFYKGAYGGKVVVDGVEVLNSSIGEMARHIGIVFQNPFTQITAAKLTVYEEIAFGLENLGMDRVEMVKRIDYVLDLLGLYDFKDRNPFELSGGQMQRLAIAGIIAMKPTVIVLDEPTSQLDPQGSEEVFKAVQRLSKEGVTIVMVEQKMEKISQYADKVMLISEGKMIDFDSPQKLFSREDLENYGVEPPVFTTIAKKLNIKDETTGLYPVTIDEARRLFSL
jgi:energy-coupling factor transport system ATP-binding protein